MDKARARLRVLLVGNYAPDAQPSMERFARCLLDGLPRHGIEPELIRPRPRIGALKPAATGLGKWLGYGDKFGIFPHELRRRARTFDVMHVCDHSNAFYVNQLDGRPHLVTCHDLLAVRSAQRELPMNPTRWSGRQLQRLVLAGLRRAQRVACVSEATRADFLRLTGAEPSRGTLVPNGLNYRYEPMAPGVAWERVRALTSWEPETRYVLHVGGDAWYKNRAGVVRIFSRSAAANDALRLVMVGPTEIEQSLQEAGLRERVAILPRCGNEDLRALYSAAELLLFPSLAEGFGWPIIEAQACGCRVATTGAAPMNEVGGDAGRYFSNEEEAAAVVAEMLHASPEERAEQSAAGLRNAARFSTEAMLARYAEIYRELAR